MAEVKAHLKYLRISPRKVRLVTDLIKGLDAKRAELELSYLPKRSSLPILKLLRSAVANAKHNFQLPEEGLYIKEIFVNSGTVIKRFTPRAFGRASPIRKRTSHISLVLDTRKSVKPPSKKRVAERGPAVRDLTQEDIKEEFASLPKEEKETGKEEFHRLKAKPTNFVRRVFRRKAI